MANSCAIIWIWNVKIPKDSSSSSSNRSNNWRIENEKSETALYKYTCTKQQNNVQYVGVGVGIGVGVSVAFAIMTGSECNTAIPNIRFGALLTLCYCISWFGRMIQWNNVRIGAHHILFEWVKQTLRWLNELLFLILNFLFIVCAIRYQQNRSTVGALCWHFLKTFQQPPLK